MYGIKIFPTLRFFGNYLLLFLPGFSETSNLIFRDLIM